MARPPSMQASEEPTVEDAHRVAGLRGVPEVCQHVDTPGLDLRRLGILVLVDDVLVDAQVHELADLVVSVGLAKGGQVLPGIAV